MNKKTKKRISLKRNQMPSDLYQRTKLKLFKGTDLGFKS